MDDICIVCSNIIDWPAQPERGTTSNGQAQSQAGSEDGASSSGMQRTGSGKPVAVKSKATRHHHHAAGGHHHGVKIRKNTSSGRLAGAKGKHGLKPLTANLSTSALAAAAPSQLPESSNNSGATSSYHDQGDEENLEIGITASNLPDWMSIYCSEECRKEDELRSRLSFANLNDERIKLSPSPPVFQNLHGSRFATTAGLPSSPLNNNDSEGSEFDWSGHRFRDHGDARRDSGAELNSNGSRRYSDGSDSSRLSAPRYTSGNGNGGRRSSSKNRSSTDSLASMGDGYHYDPSTSSYRPDLVHRPTSALSSGLRAMTPIHMNGPGSPRDRSSPVRLPSPSRDSQGTSVPQSVSSTIMIKTGSDMSSTNSANASATFIPSSSRTFRPGSVGTGGLRPSKSSATLALTGGQDVRATIAHDQDLHDEDMGTTYRHSSSQPTTFRAPVPRKHTHRPHPSNSSIPYLSCSPSSPGSGSVTSARSITSTDPSSASARGEMDDSYYSEQRKVPYVDERNKTASLSSYGLFHHRTPSTPSLTALANHGTSYGRSPPVSRHMRLSSSYDTMSSDATISKGFRGQQAVRHKSSSNLVMTAASPRRATFDVNASYGYDSHALPSRRSGTTDSTPTQSVATSRAASFTHEVVHEGRSRAPSITRTDLERTPSDRSMSSVTAPGRRQPSYLRPSAKRSKSFTSDGSGSSPPSPGLHTPGRDERPSYSHRQPSHPAINQIQNEDYGMSKPLTANSRSKSRSSFTWDHLPSYVPQYAALDLDKIRRNKSGTSLHSVHEEPQEDGAHMPRVTPQPTHRKRLFYFPDDV